MARTLRSDVARLPRVRTVLVRELVQGVLTLDAVRLAAAAFRAGHADAQLTLALRLCDAVDPIESSIGVGTQGAR